jgi:hypothetical protein
VDSWTFVRAADVRELTIVASDRAAYLERQVRVAFSYAVQTVGYLAQDLLARGGLCLTVAAMDGALQYTSIVNAALVHAGAVYLTELARILAIFDGAFRVSLIAGSGPAFPVVEQAYLFAKSPGQSIAWTYTNEPEHLQVTRSGDRANHIVVYGSPVVPSAFADSWDFADVGEVAQERFALSVDAFVPLAGVAQLKAALELAREQRLALEVQATLQPNPALELLDAVQFNDLEGSYQVRITELHTTFVPEQGLHDLILLGEGL